MFTEMKTCDNIKNRVPPMADPDVELRRGGGGSGLDLLALLAFFHSVISSSFTQNKGGGRASPRSATGH